MLILCHAVFFYLVLHSPKDVQSLQQNPTLQEVLLTIWVWGFCLTELEEIQEDGIHIHYLGPGWFWNWIDLIYLVGETRLPFVLCFCRSNDTAHPPALRVHWPMCCAEKTSTAYYIFAEMKKSAI